MKVKNAREIMRKIREQENRNPNQLYDLKMQN